MVLTELPRKRTAIAVTSAAPDRRTAAETPRDGARADLARLMTQGYVAGRVDDISAASVDVRALAESLQPRCAAAFVEGVELGRYRASSAGASDGSVRITVHTHSRTVDDVQCACEAVGVRAAATNLARTLTDLPPSQLTPDDLAAVAHQLAERHGWRTASLDAEALADAGYGGVTSVARGSRRRAWLIDVCYRGRDADAVDVALVGKGITMDCGGLNLKVGHARMATMKCDMAGGASALAALHAATELQLPLNVRVVIPALENLPGPDALLPGDVIVQRGGRTTEVTNADAEGRLVLADAMQHVTESSPEADLLTLATLADFALGPAAWALIADDEGLGRLVSRAASSAREHACYLERELGYEEFLASNVADARNYSFEHGSFDLLIAAAFLRPFAASSRWVHIDVSEATYLMAPMEPWPVGATGIPTRTLVEFLISRASPAAGA